MQRLRATISIKFYCRKSKIGRDGLAPVEMGVNVNGSRFFCNLPRKCTPGSFERKRNVQLWEYLQAVECSIRELETKCLLKGKKISIDTIREFIRNGFSLPVENIGYVLGLFYSYVDEKEIGEGVKKKYRLVMENFFAMTGLGEENVLEDITPGVCKLFVEKIKKTYRNSTYTGMLCRFKSFLNYCVDNRYMEKNPFLGIKIKKEEVKIETVTEEEYQRIRDLDLSWCKRLEKVRDLFVFSCGTGLAYTDVVSLRSEDFLVNELGQTYITKERAKTGVEYTVVVLPDALSVCKKYGYHLPSLSNQKLNSSLKAVQDLAGIKTNLTFHKARHFYACMLLNKFRFPLEVVARCLGHSSIKQSAHYAKVFSSTVFEQFQNHT